MYYKCKIYFKHGASYIDSPDLLKKRKATVNPKNVDDRCFQNAATIVLDYEESGKNPQRIMKLYPCINKYNWYGI